MTKRKDYMSTICINKVVIDIPARTITLFSEEDTVVTYPVERTYVNIEVRGYDPFAEEPEVPTRSSDYYNSPEDDDEGQ